MAIGHSGPGLDSNWVQKNIFIMAHVLNLEINLEKLSANSPNYVSLCAA